MEIPKMNRKGQMKTGTVILVIIGLIAAYAFIPGVQELFEKQPTTSETGNCPSSGLTEWTLNAQEALASTATDANVSYYIYDGNTLIANGDTGSDGTVAVDVACGEGKTYKALVLNEQTQSGFYPNEVTIEANKPTHTSNVKMYEYGQVHIANFGSATDPTGDDNISAGQGKNCGFTVTFTNNETASGINKPMLLVLVNTSAVTDVTMDGLTEVASKKPLRISAPGGHQYYAFEYGNMLLSTDSAVKASGKLQFTSSMTVDSNSAKNNASVIIVDQATYRDAQYKTLGLDNGFVEAAENKETLTDIGAPDSNRKTLEYGGTYC